MINNLNPIAEKYLLGMLEREVTYNVNIAEEDLHDDGNLHYILELTERIYENYI